MAKAWRSAVRYLRSVAKFHEGEVAIAYDAIELSAGTISSLRAANENLSPQVVSLRKAVEQWSQRCQDYEDALLVISLGKCETLFEAQAKAKTVLDDHMKAPDKKDIKV